MNEKEEYDVIVIGAGSGLEVANGHVSQGKKVAVIEPGPLGGTCLNRGCIPSKMLIHHADVAQTIRNSEKFEIQSEIQEIDYKKIINYVNEEVQKDANNIEKGISNSENHTLFRGEAKFIDEKTVEVKDKEITAEKIVISAGTRPLIPPINGLEDIDYMTSKEALELDKKPERLLMIGGGYISCELAHFFHEMGVETVIIQRGDTLIGHEDKDIREVFNKVMKDKHEVHLNTDAKKVEKTSNGLKVIGEKDGKEVEFDGDELMLAVGRVPNTDNLNVKAAGVETDERGYIEVDKHMNTSVDHIYALGDIVGDHPFKHAANLEARVAMINSIVGNKKEVDYTAMPHAIFSDPQVAGVGKTEDELMEQDTDYVSAKYDYRETGMGMALKEENGFVKVLVDPESGEILGCHIIGPEASTLIHEVLVAMKSGSGTVSDIKDTIHIHPALNEVVQRAFNQL